MTLSCDQLSKDPTTLVPGVVVPNNFLANSAALGTPYENSKSGDQEYPAGSWIVRCDQPYRNAAVTFLDVQEFPPDEPNAPYDDVAWTWPLLQDVQAKRIDDAAVLAVSMSAPVDSIAGVAGSVGGEGPVFLLRDTGQTSLATARVLLGKADVQVADTSFAAAGEEYPAGSWIVRAPRQRVEDVARRLGLQFTALGEAPAVASMASPRPPVRRRTSSRRA